LRKGRKRKTSEEREKKADLFRELTLDVYHQVIESNDVVNTKIHNTLALATGLIPIILGVFYYAVRGEVKPSLPYVSTMVLISLGFGVLCFLLTALIGAWSYNPRAFSLLRSYDFVERNKNKTLMEIKEITVATLGDIVKSNWDVVNEKANSYRRMLLFFTLGTIAFSIGFVTLLTPLLKWPC
jgi:hypothetical protein